jgi:Mrp family chromosome partitioning ATPase
MGLLTQATVGDQARPKARVAEFSPARLPELRPGARPEGHEARHALSTLVRQIFAPPGNVDGLRSVMFTSPIPMQGSESTSAATAECLAAQTGRSVCLVDANLRDPFLHRRYGVDNRAGFSDVLTGTHPLTQVAVKVASQLWLLPAGPRRPSQPVPSTRLRHSVADLLARFDYVLLGACSLGARPDAVQLASTIDGVVLVVESDRTPRDVARQNVALLQRAHVRLLGVVLEGHLSRTPLFRPRGR